MCYNSRWCVVVVALRVMLIECKIISGDLEGILNQERWLAGDNLTVYNDRLFGLEGFLFLLSLLILLYSKVTGDFKTAPTIVLAWFLDTNFEPLCSFFDITLLFPLSPMFNPTHYTGTSPIQLSTWYWMCLYHLTVCKYCSEPCSSSCWAYSVPNQSWIHICDNCVDSKLQLTGCDIHQYPHLSQYSDAKVKQ